MGETCEWDSREEMGFKTRVRVQLAMKSGDSSIFLRVWLHPACRISDQAIRSPLLLHVLWVEKQAGGGSEKDHVPSLPTS